MTCPLIHFTKTQIEEFKKEKEAPADDIVSEYVVDIQKWLVQQPHLPKDVIHESMMRKYLFGCKYNVEEVKMRLTNYYALRARFPRLYGNRDPCVEEHRKNRSAVHTAIMPQATKEGYRIQLSFISDPDPELYVPEDLIKHSHACSDLLLLNEQEISTPGIILIISGINFTVNHIAKWDLSLLKASTGILTKCRPESLKGIHFIDCNNIIKPLFVLLTSILNPKVKKRISYNDPDTLYSQVPKEILPNEFGGTAGPVQKFADEWTAFVESQRDWLMTEGVAKADMDLMPKDNEYAVFQDTFRKLDLD